MAKTTSSQRRQSSRSSKKIIQKSAEPKVTKKVDTGLAKTPQPTKGGDESFVVKDPVALLRRHPSETRETIKQIADENKLHRDSLTTGLHHRIAYRLALLGLVDVDTFAKKAKNRIYRKNGKTNMRSVNEILTP